MLKQLKSLDTHKSTNGIPYIFLKECADELCNPLKNLYRFICKRGEFPAQWKIGRITALHKRGVVSDPTMYRPVQVLINGELVFKGMIGPQLISFLSKFIPQSQFSFIQKCGANDYGALLVLLIFSARQSVAAFDGLSETTFHPSCYWFCVVEVEACAFECASRREMECTIVGF